MIDCYVGMGGNQEGTFQAMRQAFVRLRDENGISHCVISNLYSTSPVSAINQPFFLNAVCRFQTQLPLEVLGKRLQSLECALGKVPKPKNDPRLIDLDLLFYGPVISQTKEWIIPHPRWHERLFVLVPLSDVTEKAPIEGGLSVKEIIARFSNPHQEKITLLKERLEDA